MRLRKVILRIPKKFLYLKIINLIKFYLFRKFQFIKLKYMPLSMDIEPTTGCNFRCTMCDVSSPNWVTKNMKIETFKELIDMNKQLIQIKLQGMGEPFVNKNYIEFVNYAAKYGIFVQFVTNGSLLSDKVVEQINSAENISKINISIDGATKEVFEKIRIRSNFDLIVENTKKLIDTIKLKKIRPTISALSLIQKENFHQTKEIMYLCKELGFDNLSYQVQMTGWGKKDWEKNNKKQDINYNYKSYSHFFKEIIDEARSLNFKVKIIDSNLLSFDKQCSYPWDTPYVNTEGRVTPCCMIPDPNVEELGNINNYHFKDIWNSQKYLEFRKDIKKNNIRDYCKNCYKEFR